MGDSCINSRPDIPGMLLLLFVLGARGGERFIRYFGDEQAVKTSEQILRDYNEVEAEFTGKVKTFAEVFSEGNIMNIFQYKIDEELIASVFLTNNMFYGQTKKGGIIKRQVVGIYSMYVSEKYRKLGYSKKLLKEALVALDEHYGMNGDFLMMLHVDPKDKHMELAFSLYYNLNFRNGGLSAQDPFSKRYSLEEILEYGDPCDVINSYNGSKDQGKYMILFCQYSKLDRSGGKKVPYDKLLDYGARLRRILKGEVTDD